ncbi:dihydropteroate synthase [Candidatus Acetothermia bacterium]|jgi:5-methyltetrahydrofolate corrinoid/iron sulfur protein methyltransferase|nr:dihydropteroate synthase [Candidatus Acetothermia bacterium]MCI2437171.1 dihydropteroate synthase [Candidatus Acetothermia bacterium]
MILIGERINGSFKDIGAAIKEKKKAPIQEWAKKQTEAGADYLDVNLGAVSKSPEDFSWLIKTVCEAVPTPLSVDCNKLELMRAGLETHREVAGSRPLIINSTTAEESKLMPLVELAVKYDGGLIGVVMDERGSPQDVDRRVELGAKIFAVASEAGLTPDRIYLDPIVMPLKFMQEQGKNVLEAIRQFAMISDPPPHISVGLSNICSKAEERGLINRTFLVMAMAAGCDAAICNVMDTELVNAVATAELILNKEIYSDSYLKAYRKRA